MDWEGADLASAGAQPHGCSPRVGERGVDVGRHCGVDGGCCERKVVVVVKKNNVMGVGTKDASLLRARGTACAAAPCRDQNPPSLVSHGITPAARDSSAVTQARSLRTVWAVRATQMGLGHELDMTSRNTYIQLVSCTTTLIADGGFGGGCWTTFVWDTALTLDASTLALQDVQHLSPTLCTCRSRAVPRPSPLLFFFLAFS